ncbi:MAG: protein-disulfide reductase DsbD [Gammaproteobacteria bacterium]
MRHLLLFVCLAVAAWLPATPSLGAPELLRAEKAFQYSTRLDGDTLVVSWDVADGYYLYKKRFGFESTDPAVSLGEPSWPEGEIHEDEFFGESIIFRGRFDITMPVSGRPGSGALDVRIKSQGCADIGICLPPQTWTARVAFADDSGADAGSVDLSAILAGAASGSGEFLPADEAFRFSAYRDPGGRLALNWDIAPGYYLYRGETRVTLDGEPLPAELPPGKAKYDEFFGDVEVFYDGLSVTVPVPGSGMAKVAYQGCAEDGICYPPMTRTVDLAGLGISSAAAAEPGAPGASASAAGQAPEQDRLAALITDGNLLAVAGMFFGLGVLLAFTPCVLPMVPILSGLIIGQGPDVTVRRAFTLSLVFVLAMAITYTVAGVVVAMLGHNLQATFQHPGVIIVFSAIFVALALSMFGFYDLQVPSALQTRLSQASNRQQAGTLAGAGAMGFFSALIVGPCVAAPLAAALIVIGQSGDPFRGGAALFALSMGMGTPLLAFGASAGKLLPKAGPWMDTVKNFFGVLLLAVAAWMLERILPPAAALAVWAGVFILGGVFLGALDSAGEGTPGRRLARGLGLMSLVYGGVLLVGAAAGGSSPWQPLAGLSGGPAPATTAQESRFRPVKSLADVRRELETASAAGRGVMLDFYADWCVDCKRMEKYTFGEPAVQAALGDMVLLKADVTANDDRDRELMNHFGIFGPPATLFFTGGEELRPLRLIGFMPAEEFTEHVRRVDASGS